MLARRFWKIAVVYLIVGVLLGLLMGILQDWRLTSIHAHMNLLGWVSMALFGVFYHYRPAAADTTLARAHFWLHNIGVPVMQGSLAVEILTGNAAVLPIVIAASLAVIAGVILFAVNVFRAFRSAK